ncbi:MAG: dihydrofolate reductase, partial [Bacteroidales bacterium]|nr:dihydrofolate reductase [Bacteroidales bacterium]
MKRFARMAFTAAGALLALASCRQDSAGGDGFKYLIDQFADLRIIRYRIEGWEDLSLQQKAYVYHLSEAAKWGRDIYWDQNGAYNLGVRRVLENILENYDGDRDCDEFKDFAVYAKRVFFSNGIYH